MSNQTDINYKIRASTSRSKTLLFDHCHMRERHSFGDLTQMGWRVVHHPTSKQRLKKNVLKTFRLPLSLRWQWQSRDLHCRHLSLVTYDGIALGRILHHTLTPNGLRGQSDTSERVLRQTQQNRPANRSNHGKSPKWGYVYLVVISVRWNNCPPGAQHRQIRW